MINVQFPAPQFNIRTRGERRYIFDTIRKRWLVLTEEEWVRQNIIAYLTNVLQYPKQNIALEKELVVNGLKKRFDILVYDTTLQPWLMIECKAPAIPLSEGVLQQVLRYNITLPASYIMITNGDTTLAWKKEGDQLQALQELPGWQ